MPEIVWGNSSCTLGDRPTSGHARLSSRGSGAGGSTAVRLRVKLSPPAYPQRRRTSVPRLAGSVPRLAAESRDVACPTSVTGSAARPWGLPPAGDGDLQRVPVGLFVAPAGPADVQPAVPAVVVASSHWPSEHAPRRRMLGVTNTNWPSSASCDIARPALDTALRVGSAVPASTPTSSRAENPSDGIAGVCPAAR
jgi:hypothetical protein